MNEQEYYDLGLSGSEIKERLNTIPELQTEFKNLNNTKLDKIGNESLVIGVKDEPGEYVEISEKEIWVAHNGVVSDDTSKVVITNNNITINDKLVATQDYVADEISKIKIEDPDLSGYASMVYVDNKNNETLGSSKEYTDEKIASLLNNSSPAVDSIMELAKAMEDNKTVIEALEEVISNLALPTYTSEDEGKILQIVNGVPTWVAPPVYVVDNEPANAPEGSLWLDTYIDDDINTDCGEACPCPDCGESCCTCNYDCGESCCTQDCGESCCTQDCGESCCNWGCGASCCYGDCGESCCNPCPWDCGESCCFQGCGESCCTTSC